ncbi:hypothetical protein KAR48_17740 [bacterium]|nr:hypothetical protein [bacterium]
MKKCKIVVAALLLFSICMTIGVSLSNAGPCVCWLCEGDDNGPYGVDAVYCAMAYEGDSGCSQASQYECRTSGIACFL